MCKIPNVTLGIKDMDFTSHRGKFSVSLTDGREIIVPVSLFPDIQHMPVLTLMVLEPKRSRRIGTRTFTVMMDR